MSADSLFELSPMLTYAMSMALLIHIPRESGRVVKKDDSLMLLASKLRDRKQRDNHRKEIVPLGQSQESQFRMSRLEAHGRQNLEH